MFMRAPGYFTFGYRSADKGTKQKMQTTVMAELQEFIDTVMKHLLNCNSPVTLFTTLLYTQYIRNDAPMTSRWQARAHCMAQRHSIISCEYNVDVITMYFSTHFKK
jgi:hypothetical protein